MTNLRVSRQSQRELILDLKKLIGLNPKRSSQQVESSSDEFWGRELSNEVQLSKPPSSHPASQLEPCIGLEATRYRLDPLTMSFTCQAPQAPEGLSGKKFGEGILDKSPQRPANTDPQISQFRCPQSCRCRCHVRTTFRGPDFMQKFIGRAFLTCNFMPLSSAALCDTHACQSNPRCRVHVYYILPSWLLSRAILLSISWDNLTGPAAMLCLRSPRIVKPRESAWGAIEQFNTNLLRRLIKTKKILPCDVFPDGTSAVLVSRPSNFFCLHARGLDTEQFALLCHNFGAMELLVQCGYNTDMHDKFGR